MKGEYCLTDFSSDLKVGDRGKPPGGNSALSTTSDHPFCVKKEVSQGALAFYGERLKHELWPWYHV